MAKLHRSLPLFSLFNKYKAALWVVFCLLFPHLFFYSRPVKAQEISIKGGGGIVQINVNADQLSNCSKITRRHVGLGLDLKKEGHPLRLSFQGLFFTSNETSERWCQETLSNPSQENILDYQGLALDALAYYTFYKYAPQGSPVSLKPFIGGGLLYRRFILDRKQITGDMILLDTDGDIMYYLGKQSIFAIGAMPHIGVFIDIPKWGIDITLNLGWAFYALNSDTDYWISYSGQEETIYPMRIHSSSHSILGRLQIIKRWDFFSVALGYEWEKTLIDDKSIPYYTTDTSQAYMPFPEFEIKQDIGQITFSYLF